MISLRQRALVYGRGSARCRAEHMGGCFSTAVKTAEEVVSVFDADGDGELDEEEQRQLVDLAVANGADRASLEQTLRDADTDGDGKLSLEELAVIAPELAGLRLTSKVTELWTKVQKLEDEKLALYKSLKDEMTKEGRRHPEEVFAQQEKMNRRHADEARTLLSLLPDTTVPPFVRSQHAAKIQKALDRRHHTDGYEQMHASMQARVVQFSELVATLVEVIGQCAAEPTVAPEAETAKIACQEVLSSLHTIMPRGPTADTKHSYRLALLSLLARAIPTSCVITLCAVKGLEGVWREKNGIGNAESWVAGMRGSGESTMSEVEMVCECLELCGGVPEEVKSENEHCQLYTWRIERGDHPLSRKFDARSGTGDPCPRTGADDCRVQLLVLHDPKHVASQMFVDCMPEPRFAASPNLHTVAVVSSPPHLADELTSECVAHRMCFELLMCTRASLCMTAWCSTLQWACCCVLCPMQSESCAYKGDRECCRAGLVQRRPEKLECCPRRRRQQRAKINVNIQAHLPQDDAIHVQVYNNTAAITGGSLHPTVALLAPMSARRLITRSPPPPRRGT